MNQLSCLFHLALYSFAKLNIFSSPLLFNPCIVFPQAGDALYDEEKSKTLERGLFFIEVGVLKVGRDTGDTATRRGCSSITEAMMAAGKPKDPSKPLVLPESQTFRLARLGVGWVVGTMEFFHQRMPGHQVALDYCKLHHLPFSKIHQVESEDPRLVLELYKLLSYLMAQRQEATIGQLATLHSIMSSPAR